MQSEHCAGIKEQESRSACSNKHAFEGDRGKIKNEGIVNPTVHVQYSVHH